MTLSPTLPYFHSSFLRLLVLQLIIHGFYWCKFAENVILGKGKCRVRNLKRNVRTIELGGIFREQLTDAEIWSNYSFY